MVDCAHCGEHGEPHAMKFVAERRLYFHPECFKARSEAYRRRWLRDHPIHTVLPLMGILGALQEFEVKNEEGEESKEMP